jgi:hypothetical protein
VPAVPVTPSGIPAPKPGGTGDLAIFPTRVVLEGRERAAEIMLQNCGASAASYRVSLKEMEMLPSGKVQDREKAPGEITAADMIRFSPRQVDLAPGESQTVRIQVRKPEGLPDGEYRSHMLFQAIPSAEPPAPLGEDPEQKLSFSITQLVGISIPIIVRHGQTRAAITLSGLRFWQPDVKDALPVLSLLLERTGNRSVIGDFTVTVESGGKLRKGTRISELRNSAVYSNLASREVHLPMPAGQNGGLKGTKVKVTFTATDMKLPPVSATLDIDH